jgi:undecaprenyl-diphosphatase
MGEILALLDGADRWLLLLINRTGQNGLFDAVMPLLSDKRNALLPGAALILFLGWRGGRRAWAWLAIAGIALALSDSLGGLLKHTVQRIRPCHVVDGIRLLGGCTLSFSLPSNHAVNMAALAAVAWLGLPRWRWSPAALAFLVGYSRIYLGVHYPFDVFAGFVLGAGVGWLLVVFGARVLPRLFTNPEAPASSADMSKPGPSNPDRGESRE